MHTLLPVPGEVIWIRQRRWRVRRASRHRSVVRLDVAARQEQLTFLAPFDRPATVSPSQRPRCVRRQAARARLAHLFSRSYDVRTLLSAVTADVALLPYQLEPALAMLHGTRRVLLADEVGLGKTIQAGIVIAELARRQSSCRILVVCPAALVAQWRDELLQRFNIQARTADRDRLGALARAGTRGDNPWRQHGLWIASLDYLKQPHVLAALPAQPWDLVVLDEAHSVCGDSERHAAANGLARRAHQVLLLTATPHDGDERRFARLLGLGQLQDDATVFRRTRADIVTTRPRRIRWHQVALSREERQVLDVLQQYERTVFVAAGATRRSAALLLLSVFRKRAISTMNALAITLERRLAWLDRTTDAAEPRWLQPSLGFEEAEIADDFSTEDALSLAVDVGLDRRQERSWLTRLRALTVDARRHEHKVARLAALLQRSGEPAVVFTEFRHSLDVLRRQLARVRSIAVLHGGQPASERTRELDQFLDGRASVLLATDVASLGLNLQHRSRWAISFELPWNPARLEQRLGRVDRIGQTRPVHFTLLVATHDAERTVLSALARRTLIARRTLGSDVLRSVGGGEAQIRDSVFTGADAAAVPHGTSAVLTCRRWTRPARVMARSLEKRRLLAARWRTSEPDHGRPRIASVPGWPALFVFSVPILDASGAPIEERVVAVRLPAPTAAVGSDQAIEAARLLAARSLEPRAARVRRWMALRLQDVAVRTSAIAKVIETATRPAEVQPGLFDRRALRAFEAARDLAADARANDWPAELELDRPATAVVGRPRLAMMLNTGRPEGLPSVRGRQ